MNELQKSMFMGSIFIYTYINIAIFIHNIMSYHNCARENWFVVTQVLLFLHNTLATVFFQKSCFNVSHFVLVIVILRINRNKQKSPWHITVVLYNSLFRSAYDFKIPECINTLWE